MVTIPQFEMRFFKYIFVLFLFLFFNQFYHFYVYKYILGMNDVYEWLGHWKYLYNNKKCNWVKIKLTISILEAINICHHSPQP